MTYEISHKDSTEFVKSGIRTHSLSQEPELESGALDRSASLILYEEGQYLFVLFFISHIDFLYSFAHFEPNLNIFDISYARLMQNVSVILMFNCSHLNIFLFVSFFNEIVANWRLSYIWLQECWYYYVNTGMYEFLKWGMHVDVVRR